MNKINWKQKLSSRKFWAAVAGVVLAACVIFGISDVSAEQVIALVTAVGALVAYIFAEGKVDRERTNDAYSDAGGEHTTAIGFDLGDETEDAEE